MREISNFAGALYVTMIIALILFLLFGCQKETLTPCIDGYYKLENENFWITFKDGKIEGNGLANKYHGTYEYIDNQISIRIGGTKIYELNGFNNVRELNQVYEFERNSLELVLKSNEREYIFIDKTKNIY